MFVLGKRSLANLATCHPNLQTIATKVMDLQLFDFGITCGARDKEAQDAAFFAGTSRVRWPNSKHNIEAPLREYSDAFDFILYVNGKPTYEEKDKPGYYMAVGIFMATAALLGTPVRCGADWDGDFDTTDQRLHDICHLERRI